MTLPAPPFGLVFARAGRTAFTTLTTELGVLATDTTAPRLIHTIPLPAASLGREGATGLALTHDGRVLLIAAGRGAIMVDEAKAAAGLPGALLGTLTGSAGASAIEVTISADDHYAFVSQEYGNAQTGGHGDIEVFDLYRALATGGPDAYLGSRSLGQAVVGTAISPDGRWMYATSELVPGSPVHAGTGQGQLSVIDLAALETSPSTAPAHDVPAGCNPVRVVPAPDGKTVWVTARQSNALLAYDSTTLVTDPGHALLATVQVGTAPVGLIFTRDGGRIITADSNRFNAPTASTGLTVVDTHAALAGKPTGIGRIPTGDFPREFALSPDTDTLLVTNHASRQIQAVDINTCP